MISNWLMLEDFDTDLIIKLDNVAREHGYQVHAVGEIDGIVILAMKPYEMECLDLGISVSEGIKTRDRNR